MRGLTLLCCLITPLAAAAEPPAGPLGPIALAAAPDGQTLLVAQYDGRSLAVVDTASGNVRATIPLPGRPTDVTIDPRSSRALVTCDAPENRLVVIDLDRRQIVGSYPTGHGPSAVTISPDGRRWFVCNRFDNTISIFDAAEGRELRKVPAVREPIDAAVTPDGRRLLVANHLPEGRSDRFFIVPMVTVVDLETFATRQIPLPNGSNGLRGICVSPDGRLAFVTHVLSNYALVPSQVVGGWTNINAVAMIDLDAEKLVHSLQLDQYNLGAANPWGVACSGGGRWLVVAHAGTGELSLIDLPGLLERYRESFLVSPNQAGTPNDPGMLQSLRQRIPLPGGGIRAVAVIGGKAWAAGYFGDTLHAVPLDARDAGGVVTYRLGPEIPPSPERRGEMLFHDATICYQHWQSCATCHPDARVDALNWDLTNDGVGNAKNTKSMLLAHRTPPSMSTGVRATAELAVRAGLEHILFAEVPETDAAAIDAYLKSLRPVPSPRLIDGNLSPAAERGKRLFFDAQVGCAACHPPPLYTDLALHDVGTRNSYDFHSRFDTPTLVEVWRTAPYLHDGRWSALREVFRPGNHGDVDALSDEQIDDLTEFVLSL